MPTFPVKDIPDGLWLKVKERAAAEGRPIRWVALRLFEFYAERGLPNEPLTPEQEQALGRFLDNAEQVLEDAGLAPPVGDRGLPKGKP